MSAETMPLPWVEQEAQQHPTLAALLELPTDQLLDAAAEVLERSGYLQPDPSEEGRGTLIGELPIAENDHAAEWLRIRVTRASVTAVYETGYLGPVDEFARPAPRWGIRYRQGEFRFWSQDLHGGDDATLALAVEPGVKMENTGDALMRWYLALGIYRDLLPDEAAEFATSNIPPHVDRFQ